MKWTKKISLLLLLLKLFFFLCAYKEDLMLSKVISKTNFTINCFDIFLFLRKKYTYILMTKCGVGTCWNQRDTVVFVYKIFVNKLIWNPEISFFISYFVYQTVNRGDHYKVPNNENVNIRRNANHSLKRVKLLKLRTEKCLKDISLLSRTQYVFQNIKFM